jgi:prophage tail gpP-like protein
MADESVTGDLDDRVRLTFTSPDGTKNDAPILESYEFTRAILTQPSAFSVRLGWGNVTKDLLSVLTPQLPTQLVINDCIQATGFLDDVEASGEVGATEISLHGRDALARMHDAFIEAELSLTDSTYAQLVERALAETTADWTLFYTNEDNRKLTTGIGVKQTGAPNVDPTQSSKGPVAKQLKAKIGERWYEFVKRQLDRAGLFLWCGGQGEFILTAPNANQAPIYRILRRRGQTRNEVNVISARFRNATSQRFSECKIYGRGGGKKFGRTKVSGIFVDEEMTALGLKRPLVLHDDNVTNEEQAVFYARRKIAESIRNGWNLTYTVAGHTIPSLQTGQRAVWAPDTIVTIDDDEFGLSDNYYIEKVTFRRNPATTTELTLLRPDSLVFATGEF